MVAGAKKGRRTERQRISASPGGRALFWVVVLTLVLAAGVDVVSNVIHRWFLPLGAVRARTLAASTSNFLSELPTETTLFASAAWRR
jgi:hypothetical protein